MRRVSKNSRPSSSAVFEDEEEDGSLTTLQAFFVITSSLAAEVCCGCIFILNFYIPYFVSYVRIRGSKPDITIDDGKLILLLIATSFGMSGYPIGLMISSIPILCSLTIGAGLFGLAYIMIFLGVQYVYGFVIAGAICLGISAMLINMSVVVRCLRNFKENWGIVSGSLFGVAFGATAIFHIWERGVVNPLNIKPVELDSSDTMFWYFQSQDVLDRCAEFYWIMGGCLVVLISFPLLVYRIYPPPPPLEEEMIPFVAACKETISKILSDVRFMLALVAFEFGGVAGLCARSSLKTFGESFIPDEHYLSSVGSSGSLAAAVGAVTMGIILDMSISRTRSTLTRTSPKLLFFNCLLTFTASVMMMFAPTKGKVWFLCCYDIILFAYGGFSAVNAMVLFEIFGISKFPVAYGISSLTMFFSMLGYTFSTYSGLPGKEFWLANALFAFLAVGSSIALIMHYDRGTGDQTVSISESTLTDDEDGLDCIYHDGKKYVLQKPRQVDT